MRRTSRWWTALAAVAVAGTTVAATGGASASSPPGSEPATDGGSPSATLSGDGEAALAELVAAAQEDGSVTVYSSQGLDQLNALADAFKEAYSGIDVEVVRLVDGDIIPRLETEMSTGANGADLAVMAALGWIQAQADTGSFVDASASPQIAGLGAYDAAQYVHPGNFFEVGAAVLTLGWNTDALPDGLTDYTDLLDPSLAGGKIGVIDPAGGPAIVDFWRWVEENYGEDFLAQLAAQEPMIYPSALPIGEALTSGEIFATPYSAPVQLVPAQESGAPVDFTIGPNGAWGARYFGMIPSSAAHPAAAALFADFMLSPLGQELVQGASGSVLPDIPGTLITNDRVRVMDLEGMQPDAVTEYVAKWDALFR